MWYNEWVASQEQRIQKESEPWKLNNEIFDQEENSLLSSGIDSIEDQLKNNENIIHVDTAKYEQYKQKEASNESIAFGGTKKEEDSTHNKNEELKCPRCGSSLIGANDYCPGCGLKIS